jgi:hypothetical protein
MALGCTETHTYTITDRGGGAIASSGVLTYVQWSRIINDSSTASVKIAVSGEDCCAELGNVRSWRQLLNIYRGGVFVWSGFIVNVDWKFDEVVVDAIDIIGLMDRRVPHQSFNFTDTDVADIAEALIEDALAPDDPGHTVTVIGPSGVLGGRTYDVNVGQSADHLRDLADTGIDFTAVGNNIVILPDDFCEVVGRLSDEDMPEGLSVAEDGASLATRVIVAGSEQSDALGVAGGVNAYYGLLERYVEQNNISTQAAADAAAQARLASSLGVPTFIDTKEVTLAPTANVELARLVPGWCLDITTDGTCRTISQRLKITGIQVTEDGGSGGTGSQEKVTVQVASTGDNLAVVPVGGA